MAACTHMPVHVPVHVPVHMTGFVSQQYIHACRYTCLACAHVYTHVCAHVNAHLEQSWQHAEMWHSRVAVQHDKRPHPANALAAVVSCNADPKTAFLRAEDDVP